MAISKGWLPALLFSAEEDIQHQRIPAYGLYSEEW
jgi:hypothetical protein